MNPVEWAVVVGLVMGGLFGYGWGHEVGRQKERNRRVARRRG